jgi:hypothetical protein
MTAPALPKTIQEGKTSFEAFLTGFCRSFMMTVLIIRTFVVIFMHFVAKHLRHQDTKAQR